MTNTAQSQSPARLSLRWREAAAMLNCSRTFLYSLDKRGLLPIHRAGSRFSYWLQEEVEQFLREGRVSSRKDKED